MKKAERLNAMQRFAYRKRRFTLRELMEEFEISRSTAIRHIQSLEELGLPLFVEHGRYGGYRVLDTAELPPVSFHTQEVLSLYFAMQAARSLSGDPFRVSFSSIHAKFLDVVSDEQRQQIERFEHRIAFYPDESAEPGEHLEPLLQACVQSKVVVIRYATKGKSQSSPQRHIQPFAIYASQGFWYCRAYDLDKSEYRVFRCDRMESVEHSEEAPIPDLLHMDLRDAHTLRQPSTNAIAFRCSVAPEIIPRLQRKLYPSMQLNLAPLNSSEQNAYLSGHYEPEETEFMLDFLASFGSTIRILEPISLREQLREHYLRLIEQL